MVDHFLGNFHKKKLCKYFIVKLHSLNYIYVMLSFFNSIIYSFYIYEKWTIVSHTGVEHCPRLNFLYCVMKEGGAKLSFVTNLKKYVV